MKRSLWQRFRDAVSAFVRGTPEKPPVRPARPRPARPRPAVPPTPQLRGTEIDRLRQALGGTEEPARPAIPQVKISFEPVEAPPPPQPGTRGRGLESTGELELIWVASGRHDDAEFDRKDLRTGNHYVVQEDAINYAKKIPVPTIVYENQDGEWAIVIDYEVFK